MLIQTRKILVEKGNAGKVVASFGETSVLERMPGLLDITVMVNKRSKENEEVVVMIRWESEEAWKNWEKSPEHIAGHRNSKGQSPPEYIISTDVGMYEVKTIRAGISGQDQN